jgi:hypothetical protein
MQLKKMWHGALPVQAGNVDKTNEEHVDISMRTSLSIAQFALNYPKAYSKANL